MLGMHGILSQHANNSASGISHWNTGSSSCSGTEEGDISPVFVVLEHATGDFTTLGKDPLHGGSSPPSDTQNGEISPKTDTRLNTRAARLAARIALSGLAFPSGRRP